MKDTPDYFRNTLINMDGISILAQFIYRAQYYLFNMTSANKLYDKMFVYTICVLSKEAMKMILKSVL